MFTISINYSVRCGNGLDVPVQDLKANACIHKMYGCLILSRKADCYACQDCHQEHLDPWTLCPSFYLGPAILFNIKSEKFTFYSACCHILTDSLVADPHLLGHKIKHFQTKYFSRNIGNILVAGTLLGKLSLGFWSISLPSG